jgi:hypothetical protein
MNMKVEMKMEMVEDCKNVQVWSMGSSVVWRVVKMTRYGSVESRKEGTKMNEQK